MVFENDKVKANSRFRLFIPGYLQFFYEDGGEGDWCNSTSFSSRKEDRPMLTLDLRAEINSIVREVNDAIESAVTLSSNPERAHSVDLDSQIADQRFCQPGHTLYDQYFGGKVLFWNLAPEGVILRSEPTDSGTPADGSYQVRDPTPDEFDHWLEIGAFTTDAREVRTNMTVMSGVGMAFSESHGVNDNIQWLNQMGPYRNLPGLALCTFQPKAAANKEIANVISKEIRYCYTHKPFRASQQAGLNAFDNGSIQIALREFNGYFSWFVYHGPYGFAVNPCGDSKFTLVHRNIKDSRSGLSLVKPPYVESGRIWKVDIPGWWDCRFASAKDGPGALKCSNALIYDFGPEPFPSNIIRCHRKDGWPNSSYHRAWVVEY